MQNYKIITVLKSLNKKEFKKFGEFVTSPYYNKNQNVVNAYNVLSKYYPEFNSKNLVVEKIFTKVFPGEEYDYHKINNIVSDLYQLSEKFFSTVEFENTSSQGNLFLLRQLHKRKLDKLYEQKYNSFLELINGNNIKDDEHYLLLHTIYEDYSRYASETNPNTNLDMLQLDFDAHFTSSLIKMLRFYNLMLHERSQNNVSYEMRMFEDVFNFLEKNNFEAPPILSIHKNITYLETKKEEKYYFELKQLKKLHKNEINETDLHLLYIHAIDFVAYNINVLGNYSYYKDAFELNKESIEDKVHSKELIKYFDFLNFVKVACAAEEFDWALRFIEDFKSAIPAEELDNVLNFSYGAIEYKKGNLEKALKFFSKSNFSNFLLKVQVKINLCKIYYELKMDEQALSMIDTFRHYLLREKMIVEQHKESFYSFLKYLTQLIKIKENSSGGDKNAEFEKIRDEVSTLYSNQFGVRKWLIDKINLEMSSN